MNKLKKIFFLLPNLNGGGAERVVLNLMQALDKNKYSCKLIVLSNTGEFSSNVDSKYIINLNRKKGFLKHLVYLKLVLVLWKYKPSILLSSMFGLNSIISFLKPILPSKMKLLVRETGIISLRANISVAMNYLCGIALKKADIIISQSDDMSVDLINNYGVNKNNIFKIHNPINHKAIEKYASQESSITFDKSKINLVTIGKFEKQKGYEELLQSFGLFAKNTNYHLHIVGRGPLRSKYYSFITKLGLSKCVTIHEFVDNPYANLKAADLYISSSKWEGFPNVVLEALCCGLPIVANNYKGGISEIINESNGIICDMYDSSEFETALSKACLKNWDKDKIKIECIQNYKLEKVILLYEQLFDEDK